MPELPSYVIYIRSNLSIIQKTIFAVDFFTAWNVLTKNPVKTGIYHLPLEYSSTYSLHSTDTCQLQNAKINARAFTHPAASNIWTKLPLLQQLCYRPEHRIVPMGAGLLPINFPPITMTPWEKYKTENSSLSPVSCRCFSITSGH